MTTTILMIILVLSVFAVTTALLAENWQAFGVSASVLIASAITLIVVDADDPNRVRDDEEVKF
jgi:hypothetical protein